MAWLSAEEARVQAIEETINELQIAVTNLMSKQQMRQLLLIKQQEIEDLTTRIAALESQITILQNRIG